MGTGRDKAVNKVVTWRRQGYGRQANDGAADSEHEQIERQVLRTWPLDLSYLHIGSNGYGEEIVDVIRALPKSSPKSLPRSLPKPEAGYRVVTPDPLSVNGWRDIVIAVTPGLAGFSRSELGGDAISNRESNPIFSVKLMKVKIVIFLYVCFCCVSVEQRPQAAEAEQQRFSSVANKSPTQFSGLLFESHDFRLLLCSQAEIFKLTKMESCLVDWGGADPIPRVVHIAKDTKVENVMDEVMSPLSSLRHHQLRLVKRNRIVQSPTHGIIHADAKDFLIEPVEPGDIFLFAARY